MGGTFAYKGVDDQRAFDAAIADGWHPDMPSAVGSVRIVQAAEALEAALDDVSPATRDELETKAKELGIGFNSRTSDTVLAQRIAGAL
jgi:hypothetical protein